ncbi:MAG: Gfo/Idh/MocA family protein [Candidatus Dojkabacteria bacterium]
MNKRKVGIIGCGHILVRHLEAINSNPDSFELVALCDIDKEVLAKAVKENGNVKGFTDYKEMLKEMKGEMTFVTIATPNNLHYSMAMEALNEGYDVLIEKPIVFEASKVQEIQDEADKLGREAYCVLQVRYNPTVKMMKEAMKENLLGDIRCMSFIQRWQRPVGYFTGWRASLEIGGRSLYEYGIHYLDIVQTLFGVPEVKTTHSFNHKHLNIPFEDTLYSIVEYKNGASGTIEVNVAVEPSNLECSMSVMGSKGFVKISGNALDIVEKASFESDEDQKKWEKIQASAGESITPNSYGTHVGSCPNHPVLYEEIAKGNGFKVSEAMDSIQFINDLYSKEIKEQ